VSREMGEDRASFLRRVRVALDRRGMAAHSSEEEVGHADWSARAEGIRAKASGRWEELLSRFTAELEAVAGVMHRAAPSDVPALVSRIAKERRLSRIVAWSETALGLPGVRRALQAEGLEVTEDSLTFRHSGTPEGVAGIPGEIERGEIGLTGVDYAIAETGALVLLSGPGKGRLVSSLPVVHVALLRPGQLVQTLEEFGVLLEAIHHPRPAGDSPSSITFITGPSRTADIGLSLTRGVHGPKEVHVIAVS